MAAIAMTPERWKRIDDLYHAAQARPPSEHAAFLAEACADDEGLRRDVESLLDERVSDDGFLAGPAVVLPAHIVSELAAVDMVGMVAMTGRSLGAYDLQALLGAGGMGEVYRSHDTKLGRDVAIKILPRAFTSEPDRLARFEREARMLAALNHPNICAIYGVEEADGIRFLILELVEGETLADLLSRQSGSGLPVREALAIARQIADALDVAHDKGIIHRDLKPANIKITADGVVKVLDFGLAKHVSGNGSALGLTHAPVAARDGRPQGVVMGTAAYMSPEQARGLTVDERTDIWAFGCVLYEMLTARVAFAGDTTSDSIAKVLEREPDWVALPTGTPASIRRLLLRCLAKDPRKRLRDIGDARLEIDATDEEVPGGSETSARTPRPWMMALAIAAVGVSLLPAAVSWLTPLSIDSRLATAVYTHLTEWEGAEMDAAISRDGRFVAFVADRAGPFHTFLTQVGTEGFRDLSSGNDNERNSLNPPVGFSADGSELFLSGSPYSRRRLRKMAFTGGAPSLFLEERAISMAWSPDGARLVYFTATPADGDPLFVADRTGGNAHNVLPGKDGEHNHFPTWSPDSRWIYYVHFTDEPDLADLWRLPASGGTPERLTEQHTDVRYPTPIDDQVLYVSHAEDRSGPWLWAVDVERKRPPRRVRGVGPDKYLSLAASADGRRLVTTVGASTATLWSVPIGGSVAEESDVRPYQMPAPRALAPRFANPWLFYLSSGGFADGLWRLQDGNAVQVWKASDGGLLGPAAVSTDGQVAVTLRTNGRAHLVVVSADGAVRRSLANGIHVRGTAAWSPDGKWIVTGGRDDEGVPGLFKIPADGREPMRLVTGQAVDPVWSPDGNLIVYAGPLAKGTSPVLGVDPHGRSVTLPPIRTGAAGGDCGGCLRFLPDGKGLVYILGETGAQGFWLLDLITNTFRPLARLSSAAATRTFDITPDGRQIVFDRIRQNADIVLIDLPKE